jgi:hypothetical protein
MELSEIFIEIFSSMVATRCPQSVHFRTRSTRPGSRFRV